MNREDDAPCTFHIRVDGGPEQTFVSHTSLYSAAVMSAFGKLELPYPCEVEIWVPEFLPVYGPYHYRIDDFADGRGNHYGAPSVMQVIRPKEAHTASMETAVPGYEERRKALKRRDAT